MRDGSPRTARESGQLRLDVDVVLLGQITQMCSSGGTFPSWMDKSQHEMGTLTTRLQGVREPQWQIPSRRQGRLEGCELRGLGVERSPTAL